MPGAAGAAPAAASRLDHVGIIAVEEVQAARVGPEVRGFDAVDEHQHRGAVGVFLTVRQPDRLQRGISNALRQRIGADVVAAAGDPTIAERLAGTAQVPNPGGPAEFAALCERYFGI